MNTGIRQSVRHMQMLGVIAPFAAASSGANTFLLLTKAMAKFIKVPFKPWQCPLCSDWGNITCLDVYRLYVRNTLHRFNALMFFDTMLSYRWFFHILRQALPAMAILTAIHQCLNRRVVRNESCCSADLPAAAVPARSAVLVPRLQLGAPALACPAPGGASTLTSFHP